MKEAKTMWAVVVKKGNLFVARAKSRTKQADEDINGFFWTDDVQMARVFDSGELADMIARQVRGAVELVKMPSQSAKAGARAKAGRGERALRSFPMESGART